MDERRESETVPMKNRARVERKSDRELVVTRTFDAPARIVYEAWTRPDLFKRWWVPKSMGVPLLSCEMDARAGGSYRLEFGHDASDAMAFFGKYLEATPPSRLVWTNEEGDDGPITTATFEEKDGEDAAGPERALSLEGSARQSPFRDGGRDARAVRAAGRGSCHAGVMTSLCGVARVRAHA